MNQNRKTVFLTIAIVVLLIVVVTQYFSYSSKSSKRLSQKELNKIEQENNWYKSVFQADKLWLSDHNPEAALEALNKLLESEFANDDIVNKKIRKIKELNTLKNQTSNTSNNLEDTLSKSQKDIDSLIAVIDSLSLNSKQRIQKFKMQNDSLKFSLNIAKNQLNRKNEIQILTFKNNAGNLIHYLGEVSNGKANGGGKGIWNTGSLYTGDWKNNKRHGTGTFEWADGEKYVGDYVEDIRQGTGTYYWKNGQRYDGEWKNNKRNGQGTLYDKDGNPEFEGLWVDDVPQR